MNLAERKIWIMQCRAFFYSTMGAVVQDIRVMWWPVVQVARAIHQVLGMVHQVLLAGYMSESRGLHWDRKRGKK